MADAGTIRLACTSRDAGVQAAEAVSEEPAGRGNEPPFNATEPGPKRDWLEDWASVAHAFGIDPRTLTIDMFIELANRAEKIVARFNAAKHAPVSWEQQAIAGLVEQLTMEQGSGINTPL